MNIGTTFTTRHDGDMQLESVWVKRFKNLILAQQVHGPVAKIVTVEDVGKVISGVDGLVYKHTSDDSVSLGIQMADCVPILAWDSDASVIGAAHAGWKGTLGNIAGNVIAAMRSQGADPTRIHVSIGPHIGMCCYDVPASRAEMFLKHFDSDTKVASFFEDTWHVDIGWANYVQLVKAGVLPQNITAPIHCTSCQVDTYFSYRKDSKESFGEQMGVIWIGKN